MANLTAKIKLIDEMSSKLDGIARSGQKALDQWENTGNAIDSAFDGATGSTAKTADAIQGVEELLVSAGIVKGFQKIGEAFIDCAEDAIEFESAITGVYKTVDGTEEQLAQISDEVKDLSLNIPSTTTEIAAVAEAAGQLGIATEDVMTFTEVMINLGESTNLTADEAASSLAKFANITGTTAENYENLGSTIVALGNNFATTEADIVAMSTRMASAGTLAGMTESDILALSASLSSVGIEAEAGGSSMSTLITKVQLAVETGNDQLEQFASVAGYTADEFSQKWGEDAAGALYEFIAGLNDTARNGASATAILDEMGITEIRLSNAIKALANNSDSLGEAIQFSSDAWDENSALAKEANTRYATLESRLSMTKNAATNLTTEIGEVFTPTIGGAADVASDFLNGLTDFVKEHPTVVKAVAAITVGVAAFTVGIAGYVAVANVATVATKALTTAMNSNPYLLLGSVIVGVVAALATFVVSVATAEEKTEELTSATLKQADELDRMKAEYEQVCDTYGETSYQAQELSWKIEDLTAEYEAGKQTMEEYRESFDETIQSYYDMTEEHEKAAREVENEAESIIALVYRLEELTEQTDVTAAEQEEILSIIEALNEAVPDLSLSYDDLTNNVSSTIDAILLLAEAEAASRKYEEYQEQLIEKMQKRSELQSNLTTAEKNQAAALERVQKAEEAIAKWREENEVDKYGITDNLISEWNELDSELYNATMQYNEFTEDVNEASAAMEENEAAIKSTSEAMAEASGAITQSAEDISSYEDAVNYSLTSVESDIKDLCTSYDEAYAAARESIDGQIGLFQEMVVETETSVEEMMGAWESQILYLESYNENLKKALDFGFDEALVEQLSDGSEESAAYLDTIISKAEELGGTTEEAKNFVDEFNTKFQEVETAKDEFSETVADMETDFTKKMKEMEKQLEQSIDNMNIEEDAAKAAKDTMSAYIQEIIDGGNSAVLAAASAAARVRAALETGTATTETNTFGVSSGSGTSTGKASTSNKPHYAYASGTDYAAPGVALVGENGPELVRFAGGETVYPADETSRILAKSAAEKFTSEGSTTTGKEDSKTIRLEINGNGAIEVDKSMNKETVVGILYENLKPVLMSIVKQEIYEEGELAYDF